MAPQGQIAPKLRALDRNRNAVILLLVALAMVALTGCSRGAYPLDFFTEMHYQQSYKIQESPSLSAPTGSVPVTGAEVEYTLAQARLVQNPVPKEQGLAVGKKLFQANCSVCHGDAGLGDGPMKARLTAAGYLATPANLTGTGPTKAKPDGEVFLVITKGFAGAYGLPADSFVMPGFRKLLTDQEQWELVHYIRQSFQQ